MRSCLSATKVAAIQEQRHETHKPPTGRSPSTSESSTSGNVSSTTYGATGGNYGDTGGNYGDTGGNYGYSSSSGTQPGVSASENIVRLLYYYYQGSNIIFYYYLGLNCR